MDAARKREGYFFAKRPAGGPWSNAITANVRFGSLADIRPQSDDVRFTPESRHGSGNSDVFACPEKQH